MFRSSGPGITKVNQDRKMYAQFVAWVEQHRQGLEKSGISPGDNDRRASPAPAPSSVIDDKQEGACQKSEARTDTVISALIAEEALIYFNKKYELEARVTAQANRERVRKTFCGHNVRDWMGLGDHWRGVKLVMDEVRKRMGGEDGVLRFLDEIQAQGIPGEAEERLKEIVVRVRDELGIAQSLQSRPSDDVASSGKDSTQPQEG